MKDLNERPAAHEWLGCTYRTLLATADTGGSMSITETVTPAQAGPARHIHHDADEIFVVLSGDVEFWLEGETVFRGPGETAFIPRGKEHTFRAVGTAPARQLVILTPGGFEGFWKEAAQRQLRIPLDMPEVEEAALRHHLEFTGPPLGAS